MCQVKSDTMDKKTLNFEIKGLDSEDRVLYGYASTFGGPPDDHGDIVVKGAFAESVIKIKAKGLVLLDSHVQDSEHVLGTVIDAIEDDHGLFIKAKLASTPRVDEIRQKMQQGHLNKMSIGFFITKQSFKTVNSESVRFIEGAELIEISVVPIPANSRAEIVAVKSQQPIPEEIPMMEEPLEDLELKEITEAGPVTVTESPVTIVDKTAVPNLVQDSLVQRLRMEQQLLNRVRRKHNG